MSDTEQDMVRDIFGESDESDAEFEVISTTKNCLK